jgi:hypothetical protein
MRENLLHFPISYYVSIKFTLYLPVPCAWFAISLCPEVPTLHSADDARRHRPQLLYAAKTTTNTAIVVNLLLTLLATQRVTMNMTHCIPHY